MTVTNSWNRGKHFKVSVPFLGGSKAKRLAKERRELREATEMANGVPGRKRREVPARFAAVDANGGGGVDRGGEEGEKVVAVAEGGR